MEKTTELHRIVILICTDYIQLLTDVYTEQDEMNARYSSYSSLFKTYPQDTIYSLVSQMIIEVRTLSIQNRDNMRNLLYNMFKFVSDHKYSSDFPSFPAGKIDIADEDLCFNFIIVDQTIRYVAKSIRNLITELGPAVPNKVIERGLTKPMIALICYYNNTPITKKNATDIAKSKGATLAGGLYQDYSFYSSRANRLSMDDDWSKIKKNNKIRLFEKVISHLITLPNIETKSSVC